MSTATEARDAEVGKSAEVPDLQKVQGLQKAVGRPETKNPRPELSRALQVRAERLFSDVLLESSGQQRKRRTVAAVLSFAVQCLVLGVLLIVPLMFTDVLPPGQLLTFLMAPPPPPPPPPAASETAARVVRRVESDILNGQLRTPTRIPQNVQLIREEEPPPDLSAGVPGGVPGGIPGGQMGGVIGGILSSTPTIANLPKLAPTPVPKRIRVSQGVTEGRLIRKVEPRYPPLALSARIQGQVLLSAVISKSGEVQNLLLVSGHPMLVPAAIDAVKQWRYRPYLLNGEPVEVETTITVNFQLY